MRSRLTLLVGLLWCVTAQAAGIDQPLADAAQERTAHAIFKELRCVVCEGQSLAESDATLAVQMRAQIRGQIRDGKSQAEILDYYRTRYGEHILMTPPFKPYTLLLWLAPLLLLIAGGYAVWRVTAHPKKEVA